MNLFKIIFLYKVFFNIVLLICFVKEKNDGLGGGGVVLLYILFLKINENKWFSYLFLNWNVNRVVFYWVG